MAGYRRVNYYELCRLCTSSEGTKMHIFREEGRRRSLPSKIQTCLPLQVEEEDSLPKIICSTCVEKLESYFEFRKACINAEAMLESYFTSLKYSEDFTREGKVSVYVKDEPPKKKDESTFPKHKVPVSNLTDINNVTNVSESNNVQAPPAIQILTDAEGNRLTQYKVQVLDGIPSLIPVGNPAGIPINVSLPTSLTSQQVKQQSTSTSTLNNSKSSDGETQTSESSCVAPPPILAAVAITPHNQELLQHIGIATKDRNVLAEMLKLKNINVLDTASFEPITVTNPQLQGTQINNQISNLIPTPIRIDHINHLINPNYQINLSHIQQPNQEDNTLQNKNIVNVNQSVNQMTQNEIKAEGSTKISEEVDVREQKVTTTNVNGNNDQINNSQSGKTNMSMDENEKTVGESTEKFNGNEAEVTQTLENLEEVNESQQVNTQSEENMSYECEFCGKLFKRKEHLFQHRKSHSGERPFVCGTCAKAFSRKEHLLRHNVSHTGQKQYMCDICKKSFSRKDNLHKHKKTHGINGPHVCETCGKSFVVKHYYAIHKTQHENLPNTENSTGVAIKHLTSTNSTVNPLPFKCDLCNKSFSMKQYLTSHRMRHRIKMKKDSAEEVPEQQPTTSDVVVPRPTILTTYPATATPGNLAIPTINTQLTTINPNALLAPNLIHPSAANVVQIGSNSYICTPNVTQELLDQYRKLHTS